jgi:hypothetical protein
VDKLLISISGLSVQIDRAMHIAALRYFDAVALQAQLLDLGIALPASQQAIWCADGAMSNGILAWRSPTETLLLAPGAAPFELLNWRLGQTNDACCVEQTGGFWILRVSGAHSADLLCRLGASTSVPRQGQALTGRLAEISVMSLCVRSDELLLVVDRNYADHLLGWIRATIADM